MVLAGPGSGKTSVIVERTAYMINEGGISPSNILVVTFSRAAAKEMKERFLSFTGQQYTPVTFGTFHGVFYGILKQAYGFTAANILSDEEKFGILRELTLNYGGDLAEEGDFPEEIAREISVVKGNKIALEHYYSSCCPDEVFRQIYQGYREACQSRRKLEKIFWKHGRRNFSIFLWMNFRISTNCSMILYACWQSHRIICLSLEMTISRFIIFVVQGLKLC